MNPRGRLKLYVAGRTPRTELSIANLHRICKEEWGESYEIVVVDLLEDPETAEKDGVLATPALIKSDPAPARRLVGDLAAVNREILGLGSTLSTQE